MVVEIGGCHLQREKMSEHIDRQLKLRAALALAPAYPVRRPVSGIERSVRLSMIASLLSAPHCALRQAQDRPQILVRAS